MSYVQPSGVIQLFRGINLDNRYMHTLYFANTTAQTNWFNNQADASIRFDSQYYTRVKRGFLRIKVNAETIQTVTYMRFNNRGNKNYYAFVNSVNYINENVTEIEYEIDVMQTWFIQEGSIQPCMVKREHVSDDTFTSNLEHEPIASDIYDNDLLTCKRGDIDISTDMSGYNVVIQSSNEVEDEKNLLQHGIFCGTEYYSHQIYDDAGDYSGENLYAIKYHMGEMLGSWDKNEQSAEIVDLYMFPHEFAQDARSQSNYTYHVPHHVTETNDYKPVNNKLHMYPYSYLFATTKDGDATIYRWEYFDGNVVTNNTGVDFVLEANPTGGGAISIHPRDYNGITDNLDAKLSITNFPKCSWSYDAYEAWVASGGQTKLNAEQKIVNLHGIANGMATSADIMGVVASGARTATAVEIAGATGGLTTPYAVEKAAQLTQNIASTSANIVNRYASQLEAQNKIDFEFKDVLYKPDIVVGQQTPNIAVGGGYLGFYFFNCHVRKDEMIRLDNFLSMYGYAVNTVKVPNITGRKYWNFVQTDGAMIKGNMPATSKAAIARIFDGGVFFWNSTYGNANIGNFKQEHSSGDYSQQIKNPIV